MHTPALEPAHREDETVEAQTDLAHVEAAPEPVAGDQVCELGAWVPRDRKLCWCRRKIGLKFGLGWSWAGKLGLKLGSTLV